MKAIILQLFAIMLCTLTSAQEQINVMTFNIRFNNPGDSLNAWPYRKDKAASQVRFHEAHLIGLQEALYDQVIDLQQRLPNFKYVGGGRDDGKQKGEFSAILIDTTRFQIINTQTFWLSEQPEVPGKKGWDAAFPRIVTWAKLKDRITRKEFYMFNTHFDHMGQVARRESAKLLLEKVKEIAGNNISIITGDFNSKPQDEPIQVLTDNNNPSRFTDTYKVSVEPHYGPKGTFNAFGPKEIDDVPIDYIFIRNGIKVLKHATLSQTWQGRFSSDHFPVFAQIRIQ